MLTPFPAANHLIDRLLAEQRAVLGARLAGLYVFGSLAVGGFDPRTSDVDCAAAAASDLTPAERGALAAAHRRLFDSGLPLAGRLECSYLPLAALRRHDPSGACYPRVERGSPDLTSQPHDMDWIINRHCLREYGLAAAGPHPKTLIDPVAPSQLRAAARDLLAWWWGQQLEDTRRVAQPGYQRYAALSVCRILYTLAAGGIASKPAAARWALQTLPARWHALIEDAIDGAQPFDRLDETLAFIRFAISQAEKQ